jgi:membrane protein insertase Oxa1/YidC/SpoIIIJ
VYNFFACFKNVLFTNKFCLLLFEFWSGILLIAFLVKLVTFLLLKKLYLN